MKNGINDENPIKSSLFHVTINLFNPNKLYSNTDNIVLGGWFNLKNLESAKFYNLF